MQTMTKIAGAVKIEIAGTHYAAGRLADGADGERVVRLEKLAGGNEVYDVAAEGGLVTCTCPHYEYRLRGNSGSPCKHGAAVVAAGLLADAPDDDTTDHAAPEPAPTEADREWHATMADRDEAEASWHELTDADWDEAYADRSGQAFPAGWHEIEAMEAAGHRAYS